MNFMKPKNTALNPKALLYKRFLGLEKTTSLDTIFVCILQKGGLTYWLFDKEQEKFVEITQKADFKNKINVGTNQVYAYKDKKYLYNDETNTWDLVDIKDYTLLSQAYAPTATYQTNRYYFAGSFDFMIKGGIEGSTSQPIKGNIMTLDSMNITYYEDNLCINRDDLVVINGKLFFVEDTEVVQKRMPKPYNIYSSTLVNRE